MVFVLFAACVLGHGAIVTPRSRNSIDYLVGVNTPKDWPSNAGKCRIAQQSLNLSNLRARFPKNGIDITAT
jgi:hypothetical protein